MAGRKNAAQRTPAESESLLNRKFDPYRVSTPFRLVLHQNASQVTERASIPIRKYCQVLPRGHHKKKRLLPFFLMVLFCRGSLEPFLKINNVSLRDFFTQALPYTLAPPARCARRPTASPALDFFRPAILENMKAFRLFWDCTT